MTVTAKERNQWCPGCPNNLIHRALAQALEKLALAPEKLCLVSGIGQAAKMPHYLPCNFFNGLHGRALPVALGIAAANPNLTILVTTGDGDCYGEGGNHLLHTLRRNPNLTVIVHNNAFYALTKGQASPTTPPGEPRDLHPEGVFDAPLNPLGMAILHGCGFVARGSALEADHLTELIIQGINHRGLSLIDVRQPCITWDKHPLTWHKARTYRLGGEHDPNNFEKALRLTMEEEKLGLGVIYRKEPTETFGERFRKTITDQPLATLAPPTESEFTLRLAPFRADLEG